MRDTRKLKYQQQKQAARQRNIPFLLTFDEWWQIWKSSGHWKQRGKHSGQFCMARFGDKGPYKVGNVRIVTVEENLREYHPSAESKAKISAARQGRPTTLGRKRPTSEIEKIRAFMKKRWAKNRKLMLRIRRRRRWYRKPKIDPQLAGKGTNLLNRNGS